MRFYELRQEGGARVELEGSQKTRKKERFASGCTKSEEEKGGELKGDWYLGVEKISPLGHLKKVTQGRGEVDRGRPKKNGSFNKT